LPRPVASKPRRVFSAAGYAAAVVFSKALTKGALGTLAPCQLQSLPLAVTRQRRVNFFQRGLAYNNLGDYDNALAGFEKAYELDPTEERRQKIE